MTMPAYARTIYVKPAGDDAWVGTSTSPYRTTARAHQVAVAGDTILVGEGHYPERLEFSKRVTLASWDGVASIGTGVPSVSAGETQVRPICENKVGLPLIEQPFSPSAQVGSSGGGLEPLVFGASLAVPGHGEVGLRGEVTDPDGTAQASWSVVSGPGDFKFNSPSDPQTWGRFNALGRYVLRLTVQNGPYVASDDVIVDTIPVICTNTPPSPKAGADQTVAGLTASLNGTITDDGLPNPPASVSAQWLRISGPGTAAFESANTAVTRVVVSTYGTYVFRLTADDTALRRSSNVSVTFQKEPVPPPPPVVTIRPPAPVVLPASAVLSATVTDDGLPSPPRLTLLWSKVSGQGSVTFNPANTANTSARFGAAGSYVLSLTASDGAYSTTKTVTVRVTEEPEPDSDNPEAPQVNAGPDRSIDLGDAAFLNGTATDDGLPNSPGRLTFTWSKVSGPGDVSFGSAAQSNTTASFSAAGLYTLQLFATDNDKPASNTVQVTVREAKDYLTTYENIEVRCGATGHELRIRNTHSYRGISYVMTLRLSTVFAGNFDKILRGTLAPGESRAFACSERVPGPGSGYVSHRIISASFSSPASLPAVANLGFVVASAGVGGPEAGVSGPELTYGISPTEFLLSWPVYAADAVLEVADELGTNSHWAPVAEPAVVDEERRIVVLPPAQAQRFFRLKLP